jgi:hypothetical protein
MITLQTIPVDCLLHIGTFLRNRSFSRIDNIDEITLAAILNDHDMLEHYMNKHGKFHVTTGVALSGNLRALRWVILKGCPLHCAPHWAAAAWSGNLDMLKWLRSQGFPWDYWRRRYLDEIRIETLELLLRKGCPWHIDDTSYLEDENPELLQWLHDNNIGFPWDEETFANAARSGNLEMLQWLHSVGCPWDELPCKIAIWSGNFEMVQWLFNQGCPRDEWTFFAAVEDGHLEIVQFLYYAGCPLLDWKDCYSMAKCCGYLEMLQWLRSVGDWFA